MLFKAKYDLCDTLANRSVEAKIQMYLKIYKTNTFNYLDKERCLKHSSSINFQIFRVNKNSVFPLFFLLPNAKIIDQFSCEKLFSILWLLVRP